MHFANLGLHIDSKIGLGKRMHNCVQLTLLHCAKTVFMLPLRILQKERSIKQLGWPSGMERLSLEL